MKKVLLLHTEDNVANVLENVATGEAVSYMRDGRAHEVIAREVIPFGFKIALNPVPPGGSIVKYANVIGRASENIQPGDLVHVHNLAGTRGRGDEAQSR